MILPYSVLILFLLFGTANSGFVVGKRSKTLTLADNKPQRDPNVDDDTTWELELDSDDPHSRLMSHLRKRARPHHRPVRHPKSRLDVHVSAGLYQVVDLDQRNNLATLSAYFDAWWVDEFIGWNASDYDGVERAFIPARWIWKPEFYLYHSIQGRMPDYANDATAEVRSDGVVRMFVPITSRALCPINVKYFPFDRQNCSFFCGSWTYQREYVRFHVEKEEILLGDFYDNQEWLLLDASLHNGTIRQMGDESFSMVYMELVLRRQSFYYVFNLVFPTTLVSLVAVIGFHAPINATGRRESKFRLGIMTLLSMSVMLLMLVGEMKFALESIPGQRGSFSDVPLLGIFYMTLILLISVATCTTSIFVHLEKYALRNQQFQAIPWYLRWMTAQRLFCCYVPKNFRYTRDEIARNNNVAAISLHSSPDNTLMKNLISAEINFTESHQDSGLGEMVLEGSRDFQTTMKCSGHPPPQQKLDLLISLMREFISLKQEIQRRNSLPAYWERLIKRLENVSLTIYLSLIGLNITLFMYPEVWY